MSTKFFHYSQNNSGGSFDFDEDKGITHHVIIEANDYQHANRLAEAIGLYFNGINEGIDCDCCGDRWYEQWDGKDGANVPSIYGEPVESISLTCAWMPDGKETAIHYLDGRIEWFGVVKKTKRERT